MEKQQKALTPIQALASTKDEVAKKIEKYIDGGELHLPQNYSAGNALTQFQLMVQDDDKLMSCTRSSLAKCMLDMCVLGLNPAKKQCYAINYGGKATLMPSYEGNKAMAKRIDPTIEDIVARTIHKGEEFDFDDLPNGYSRVIKHKRTLASLGVTNPLEEIIGAYATIVYNDGKESVSLIMPFSEIVKRWKMSKARPLDKDGTLNPDSVHAKFPDKMCERTVINAICKPIISSSNDNDLFCSVAQSNIMEAQKAEADAEAQENMCEGDFMDIDVDFSEIPEESEEEIQK